jgi:7-cyano-7-deazaguanine reductase
MNENDVVKRKEDIMDSKKTDDVSEVGSLGSGDTVYPNKGGADPAVLERFPNQFPDRKYTIECGTSELTSLCPRTHQPDFAVISISYIPDAWCIESKGLKLYFFSYREEGSFMETITNNILTHLVELVKPHEMTVVGDFAPRGGIAMLITASYTRDEGVKPIVSAAVSS